MSEFFLAVNLPTNQGFPLHRPPSYAGLDLDLEFDVIFSRPDLNYPQGTRRGEQNPDHPPKTADRHFLFLTAVREREGKDSNLQE